MALQGFEGFRLVQRLRRDAGQQDELGHGSSFQGYRCIIHARRKSALRQVK
jgi:hypothetical protein